LFRIEQERKKLEEQRKKDMQELRALELEALKEKQEMEKYHKAYQESAAARQKVEDEKAQREQRDREEAEALKNGRQPSKSITELKIRPIPTELDAGNLETYLSDSDFKSVLGYSRSDFYLQPKWKRKDLKRKAGLF